MHWSFLASLGLLASTQAAYVWPSPHDGIEDLLFLQSGYIRFGSLADQILTCDFGAGQPGIQKAAEWVRTAFHDAVTHDATAKTGGLDASILFELDRAENLGAALNNTLADISSDVSVKSSAADLLALSLVMAVARCGDLRVPLRLGRIDATEAGPLGVPEAHTDLNTTKKAFEKAGFSEEDMITLVACGHTLGSVHSVDHPEIVSGEVSAENIAHFDTTHGTFDNAVITEYLNSTTSNPLIINTNDTLNSDKRVFAADGNATMTKLKDPAVYKAKCEDAFERMLDLVPASVTLSDPLQPADVKPYISTHQLKANGSIEFIGRIRIRTTASTGINPNDITVALSYIDRNGVRSNQTIPTTMGTFKGGSSFGYLGENFNWFEFSQILPSSTGISAFDVKLTTKSSGAVTTFDNGGTGGYPINPYILFQQRNSCLETQNLNGNLTIVAAVHKSQLQDNSAPQLKLVHRTPFPRSFISKLEAESIPLERTSAESGEFTYLKVTTPLEVSSWRTSFDVELGEGEAAERLEYQHTSEVHDSCEALV
ncbi:heme peroxidase [Melanomma pulvis-pyrius CBS 109.77]|uniref:Peroxidase n=1 Tax=Melanomma pulvis-pyrius CBS 109.77 TaxID=1314802 RepID=A0A6A6XTF1_9PLEO|nr:heme peroxidase [Melanomma pulvis-pyrius CBS 109.77]